MTLKSILSRLALAVVALTALTGASLGKYAGADAGYVILSLTAKKDTFNFSYTFSYARRGGDDDDEGEFDWRQEGFWRVDKGELNDPEKTGVVIVQALAPGEYEINRYFVVVSGGSMHIPSKPPLRIPFTVRAGEAVYLGEYMAVDLERYGLFGEKFKSGLYVHLSDQQDRDVAIAKTKQPNITTVVKAVPNAEALGVGYIRSTAPPPPDPEDRPSWW